MNESIQTVMVVGYNVRPIARLAKQLGFNVIAVDYWGDLDIRDYADVLRTVLQQKPGEHLKLFHEKPISELLVDLAEAQADRSEVDFILLGSGLDDRPDLWTRLRRIAPVLGNNPERLQNIRNPSILFSIARKLAINCPETEMVKSVDEAVDFAKKIGFPVVMKPVSGSGGFRIRLSKNQDEIENHFRTVGGRVGEVWLQEYIEGVDVSSSVLGNGDECIVISVNEQLIGIKELGSSTPFGYCGNIVPYMENKRVVDKLRKKTSDLGKELGLIGSNGFDFVIDRDGEPYIMEINPRFQATIECVQYVTGLNLLGEHILACSGELLKKVPEPKGCAVKMIVFAREKCVYPDLRGLKSVFDISQTGVIVEKGNPICTVQVHTEERKTTIKKAWKIVSEVYNRTYF